MEKIDGRCSSSATVTGVDDSPSSATTLSIFSFSSAEEVVEDCSSLNSSHWLGDL